MYKTLRLTVAQAVVKYLQVQYSERDGKRRRFVQGVFGIFGHGNVSGLSQALWAYGRDLPYYRSNNEQSMVHTAAGFAKANLRLATLACTPSIGPGATNMVTGAALATINRLPVLIAGGGVLYAQASKELQTFAETVGIPVGETSAGKGAIQKPSPWLMGGCGVTGNGVSTRLLAQADLVIAVGTRLTDFTTGSQSAFRRPDVKFISINVGGRDAHKQGALPIVADAREARRALTRAARIQTAPSYARELAAEIRRWHATMRRAVLREFPGERPNYARLSQALHDQMHKGDTVVAAAGYAPGDRLHMWDVEPAEVSDDPVTRRLRKTYESTRRKLQRVHYKISKGSRSMTGQGGSFNPLRPPNPQSNFRSVP